MAKFLETLADTGIVLDACDAACKSSTAAYALRRREPLFADAWEKALAIARDRLADTLLARSIEGNVEQIIKDGEIVAEKHFIDNRLGLAMLKRADQRAEAARRHLSPSPARTEPDWDVALTALRTGNAEDIAKALAILKEPEVGEVCDPPFGDHRAQGCRGQAEHDDEGDNFNHPRLWRTWDTEEWRTDWPPPPGFTGHEESEWKKDDYCRALTDDELAALVAAGIAEPSDTSIIVTAEEDAAARDAFFSGLAARAGDDDDDPA